MSDFSIPLANPAERGAVAQMIIDLTLATHASIFPLDQQKKPRRADANLALVVLAVVVGHARGHPMTVSEIASRISMPRSSTGRRLDKLIEHGLIQCVEQKYYIAPHRAASTDRDKYDLILAKGFAVLGPYLSKLDT